MEKKHHRDVVTHVEASLPVRQEPSTPLPPAQENAPFTSLPTLPAIPIDAPPTASPSSIDAPQMLPGSAQSDMSELALRRLNDAAQRIATEEEQQQYPVQRVPRASRLAPMYDISADIRRGCAPLAHSAYSTEPMPNSELNNKLPDLWPWLQDMDDQGEQDIWKDHADPLQARRFPSSSEIKRIEEEDIRRAVAEGMLVASSDELEGVQDTRPVRVQKRLRLFFTFLVVLAIFALTFDAMLMLFAFLRPWPNNPVNSSPSLNLSARVVQSGQTLTLYIRNFSPSTQVSLTRDAQEPLLSSQRSMLEVRADGSQNVSIKIDTKWKPGRHTLHEIGRAHV